MKRSNPIHLRTVAVAFAILIVVFGAVLCPLQILGVRSAAMRLGGERVGAEPVLRLPWGSAQRTCWSGEVDEFTQSRLTLQRIGSQLVRGDNLTGGGSAASSTATRP